MTPVQLLEKNLLNIAQVALIALDRKGNILTINNKGCEVLECKLADVIGKSWFDTFIPKDQRKNVRSTFQTIVKGNLKKAKYVENHIITLKGTHKVIGWHNGYLKDEKGRITGTLSSGEDITERLAMQRKINESRIFLNKILNTIPDPLFVKNREHKWIHLNDSFCEFMKVKKEKLLGKSDYDFFPKKQADVFWQKDEIVFKTGKDNINEESFTDKKGKEHVISTKKSRFTDSKGKMFLVGIIRDITKVKKSEEDKQKLNEELQARINELERFNKMTIGRELKMVELKKEIEHLQKRLRKISK